MDRWVVLAGCDNARDLGGLGTVDGGRTRFGVLIRSDTPQELHPSDVSHLRDEIGLRTVVDLRSDAEVAREGRGPLRETDIAYHNLSFIPREFVMPDDPRFPLIVKDYRARDRIGHYLDYLRLTGASVAGALRLLAAPRSVPALFHCAAGKDRTGVLAALVLDIVGVKREQIVADYAASNERLERVEARLARMPSYRKELAPADVAELRCRPDDMAGFLDGIDETWGGCARWARSSGITEAELLSLRGLLVET